MQLNYTSEYKSLKSINSIELASFSIITGLNGVGKTQLLQAISNGSAQIEGIPPNSILYYNNGTFQIKDASRSARDERFQKHEKTAWSEFSQHFQKKLK